MKVLINAMTGQMPALEPHLLENGQAQTAKNCRFESGGIVPLKTPLFVSTPSGSSLKSIHKIDDTWFAFTSIVNACDAPVFNDANRFFFTGSGVPRKATKSGYAAGTYYNMGVPKPTVIPTVNIYTASGGAGASVQEEVSYVYCYVTAWGEQGPPSDPTAITAVMENQYLTLTGFAFPTGYSATYNIVGYRVFRLNNGTSGSEFQELYPSVWADSSTTGGHIPVASTTVTDRNGSTLYELIDDSDLGGALSSENFQPPDDDMDGLVLLSNGVLAGFVGNQVALSEPYIPYGWPPAYTLATGRDVVSLAGYDTTLVVVTDGEPWIVDCYDPSNLTPYKVGEPHPGLNARGITSGKGFVAYVSTTGLIRVSSDGVVNLTREGKLFTDKQWAALTPSTMMLVYYDGRYYVFNYNLKTGFILDFNSSMASYVPFELPYTVLDRKRTESGIFLLTQTDAGAFRIERFDGGSTSLTASFTSKRFRLPTPTNFAFAAVRGVFTSVSFQLYGKKVATSPSSSMTLLYTKTVTDQNAFRLPGGYLYDEVEIAVELTTGTKITEIIVSNSMAELRS